MHVLEYLTTREKTTIPSVEECLCAVSLRSDIDNYWPGMHYTAFFVISADLCEQET